jgi:orotidine 5'-phosphate decarboxylase subfamily 2
MRNLPQPTLRARINAAIDATGSLVCVGLDPQPGVVRAHELADVCRRVIDACVEYAAAFKPNSAFFEAHGAAGFDALAVVLAHVPDERIRVLDAKRGDIASTADAYATAAFKVFDADAVTVSPYLGADSVAPFLSDPRRGAFVLCHTSNPGAADFQHLEVNGEPLYVRVARTVPNWGNDNVGLVVGATYPSELANVRAVAPDVPILLPGIGAQGGNLAASVEAGLDSSGRGLLVSSSRALMGAADPAAAARSLRDAISAVRGQLAV